MSEYGGFASIYDEFMSGTDYDGWVDFVLEIFAKYGAAPKLLLELGCGTGEVTRRFAEKGFDMLGIDKSAEMLSVAKSKDPRSLYIMQDIRRFELYGTVDAIISLCDVFNYLLTARDLGRAFSLVSNYLNPGGLFVFDLNTPYKYRRVLGNKTFTRQTRGAAYIWKNRYYEKERVNEYGVTFFKRLENGLYRRFRERHLQRAHRPEAVCGLLRAAGLTVLSVYGEKVLQPPKKTEERIFIVAQKPN